MFASAGLAEAFVFMLVEGSSILVRCRFIMLLVFQSCRLVLSTTSRLDLIPQQLYRLAITLDTTPQTGGTAQVFGQRYMGKSKHPLLREAAATDKVRRYQQQISV